MDFEKAFDSVSWKFVYNCLTFFNFHTDLIRWIKMFYHDTKSAVCINAKMSTWFQLKRGCREGDPLSPYLSIICAEILTLLIKQDDRIKGFMVEEIEVCVSQYADDTSIFLDGKK